jgi:hypothetical protein
MSLTRDEIVERGRREWEEKSENDRDWRSWVHIGEALDVGRREVETRIANRSRSGTTARFKGRAFNERFGLWLGENGFKDLGGKKYGATRSHLMDCLEHRAAIETWRKTLEGYERTAWNHPTTVLRHWKMHLADEQEKARIAAGGEPRPKPPSPMKQATDAIRNLIDENDRLRKAPHDNSSQLAFDLSSPELIAESARNFVDIHAGAYGEDAVKQFADTLHPAARETEIDPGEEITGASEAPRPILYCSFCGKSQHGVTKLVAGLRGANICDKCVADVVAVLPPEKRPAPSLPEFDDEWDEGLIKAWDALVATGGFEWAIEIFKVGLEDCGPLSRSFYC